MNYLRNMMTLGLLLGLLATLIPSIALSDVESVAPSWVSTSLTRSSNFSRFDEFDKPIYSDIYNFTFLVHDSGSGKGGVIGHEFSLFTIPGKSTDELAGFHVHLSHEIDSASYGYRVVYFRLPKTLTMDLVLSITENFSNKKEEYYFIRLKELMKLNGY